MTRELFWTDEDGNRLCRTCGYKKPSDLFFKSKKHPEGIMYVCKNCFQIKDKSLIRVNPEYYDKYKNDLRSLPDTGMAKMTQCSKEDYLKMYEFLRGLGYDSNGDIGLQFSERHNTVYKPRDKKDQNLYLPDGTKNPLHRTYKG